jgi:putative NADPH-quinone reductase
MDAEGQGMKILALNGSPRGRKSNTDRLLLPLLEGAREEGADTEVLYLSDLNVHPCSARFSCWGPAPGETETEAEDDMPIVLQRVLEADVIVWAFPLYCYGMPALLQAVQERMLPLVMPQLLSSGDVYGQPSRYPKSAAKWVVLCNCGFPERRHFDPIVTKFRLLAGAAGRPDPVDFVLMAAGELLREAEDDPAAAGPLEELRDQLRQAGGQLAERGAIGPAVLDALNRPLTERFGISPDLYVRVACSHWEESRRQAQGGSSAGG